MLVLNVCLKNDVKYAYAIMLGMQLDRYHNTLKCCILNICNTWLMAHNEACCSRKAFWCLKCLFDMWGMKIIMVLLGMDEHACSHN